MIDSQAGVTGGPPLQHGAVHPQKVLPKVYKPAGAGSKQQQVQQMGSR